MIASIFAKKKQKNMFFLQESRIFCAFTVN